MKINLCSECDGRGEVPGKVWDEKRKTWSPVYLHGERAGQSVFLPCESCDGQGIPEECRADAMAAR